MADLCAFQSQPFIIFVHIIISGDMVCLTLKVFGEWVGLQYIWENGMPYLNGIWWVGEAKAKGVHAGFWAWHMILTNLYFDGL